MKRARQYKYDIALSVAGEDRAYAEALAEELKRRKIKYFYDDEEKHILWGKNLYPYLSDLYQNEAHYCVIFISKHYATKRWTTHEREAAQARAFQENEEYILPIRLDNTELPGILPTVAYLEWPPESAETVANNIALKLGREPYIAPRLSVSEAIAPITSPDSAPATAPSKSGKKGEVAEDAVLQKYIREIENTYEARNDSEMSYRSALENLLKDLVPGITVTHEPKRKAYGSPDFVISQKTGHGLLTIGYIETKAVDMHLDDIEHDAEQVEPKTRDGEQLKKYLEALENLILTNYREFRWYLHGKLCMTYRLVVPKIDSGIALTGSKKKGARKGTDPGPMQLFLGTHTQSTLDVARLLANFLTYNTEPINNPKDLAERMARIAHIIRDMTILAFGQNEIPDTLRDLYDAFKQVLIPDLEVSEFADMFAQTLAYGLFAARYNHTSTEPFRRKDAAREIPNTNPFLADLFEKITGRELDNVPFVGFVDDLAQLLAQTDMNAVLADFGKRSRREDPLIHFYETFLTEYDPKLRELRGVYYTPEPVVSYIVRSVDHILRTQFDCQGGLADTSQIPYPSTKDGQKQQKPSPRVLLLDPACGTGTFLYAVINHIRERYKERGNAGMWSSYVREHLLPRIFGFELLMAPYAMAHLKLGMQLAALDLPEAERQTWSYDFKAKERLGVYLTNSLEEATKRAEMLFARYISDEANAAAEIKKDLPIMVIMGNPPYSGHSANRSWEKVDDEWIPTFIGKLLQDYYKIDGRSLNERNSKWLQDDYVKFIRFSQWRIERTGHGILAFITNHGYLNNPTFRGMRQNLLQSFDEIYVLDLHGNSRKKEKTPDGSKDENVFDIQQGVAIGIFVRHPGKKIASHNATVYHAHLWGERSSKYNWLVDNDVKTTDWVALNPQSPFYIFVPQNDDLWAEYESAKKITDIMPINVMGFQTHRDHFAIDFDKDALFERINEMRDKQISDQDYVTKYGLTTSTLRIAEARRKLRKDDDWSTHLILCLYRPFDWRYCYFSDVAMDRPRRELLDHVAGKENLCLLSSRQQATPGYRHVWVTRDVANDCVISTTSREANQVFPLYRYPDTSKEELFDNNDISNAPGDRFPNFSVDFINVFSKHLGMKFIQDGKGDLLIEFGPEDIFNYMYSVFYSPIYRERYAEFLKIDFPHLPLTSNAALFRELCKIGDRLVKLHLMESSGSLFPSYPARGDNLVDTVRYTEPGQGWEQGRVWINKVQYFEGVSPEIWNFHIGGYQVCQKWLKDRKGRTLSYEDIEHYQRVVAALDETISLMKQIDSVIDAHGGWPIA